MEALYSTYFPSETYNGKCKVNVMSNVIICSYSQIPMTKTTWAKFLILVTKQLIAFGAKLTVYTSSQLTHESRETNNESTQVCMTYGTGHMYMCIID